VRVIERLDQRESSVLTALFGRGLEMFDRGIAQLSLPAEGGRLMFGRKEGAAVVARPAVSAGGSDRHEGWKVGVVAAETVGNPGAERRADEVVAAGVDHRHRLAVRLAAAVHGADDAQIIDF